MVQRKTGITKNTAKRLIIDSGVVILNYGIEGLERILGATEGGATFTVEQDIYEPEIDGLPGPLAGTRRVTAVHPRITARLLEQTTENIVLSLAGSEYEPDAEGEYDVITRKGYVIPTGDHVQNIALVGRVTGTDKPIICMIKNAIADGNFEFGMEDESEAGPELQFTGHFSAEDLDAEPWEIRNPIFTPVVLTYSASTGGTIDGEATQNLTEGDDGTAVTAVADTDYAFDKWDDGLETPTRRDTNVQADITVEALFISTT